MYKVMKIGGKDYKIEFAVEAALYDGCVSSVMELIGGWRSQPVKKKSKESLQVWQIFLRLH